MKLLITDIYNYNKFFFLYSTWYYAAREKLMMQLLMVAIGAGGNVV